MGRRDLVPPPTHETFHQCVTSFHRSAGQPVTPPVRQMESSAPVLARVAHYKLRTVSIYCFFFQTETEDFGYLTVFAPLSTFFGVLGFCQRFGDFSSLFCLVELIIN